MNRWPIRAGVRKAVRTSHNVQNGPVPAPLPLSTEQGRGPLTGLGVEHSVAYRFGMWREESTPLSVVRVAGGRNSLTMPELEPVVLLVGGIPAPLEAAFLAERHDRRHSSEHTPQEAQR